MWVRDVSSRYKNFFIKNSRRLVLRKQILLAAFAVIIPFGTAFSQFTPALAATTPSGGGGPTPSLSDQVLEASTYYALYNCLQEESQQADNNPLLGQFRISEADAKSGNWWKTSGGFTNDGITSNGAGGAASFLSSGVGSSGYSLCNDILSSAVSMFGYQSPFDFMCSFVTSRANGSSCATGSGDFGGIAIASDKYTQVVGNGVFGTTTPPIATSASNRDAANYIAFRDAFLQGCSPKESSSPRTGYAYRNIKIVQDDGTFTTKTYEGADESTKVAVYASSLGGTETENCYQISQKVNQYAAAFQQYVAANPSAVSLSSGTSSPTGAGGSNSGTTCAIQGIGWILCPVLTIGGQIADQALSFLSDHFLQTPANLVDTSGGTYQAWQGILAFANIIFVIVFLFIIFSQVTGFGVSNYGIKKMLPKLIVGAILINLSYFICQAAVDASNLLGYGFVNFFDGITKGITHKDIPTGFFSGTDSLGNIIGLIIAGGAGIAIGVTLLLTGILIPVLAAILVALFMILLILIARQAIIVIAIVIAPLAFAAWLLPNTEKLFKQWWGVFSKMLLLFPIIAIVFGASRMVSTILSTSSDNITTVSNVTGSTTTSDNWAGQLIAAAVLVVPLFAVPFLLKGALDSVPVVGKMARNWHGGAVGGARKKVDNSGINSYLKQRHTDRKARVASGNYRGKNPYGVMAAVNRKINKSGVFNAATQGYGAQRDLAAQRQGEKDRKEAVDMFNANEPLMKAWAETGGNIKGGPKDAEGKNAYDRLDDASKRQFQRMKAVGHDKKYTSFLAVADYMSQNGKGEGATFVDAMRAAKDTGADSAELGDTLQGSIASYRKSGRGDIIGDIQAIASANGDGNIRNGKNVTVGNILGNTGFDKISNDTRLAAMTEGWSKVDADKVHRDGVKPGSLGLESYIRQVEMTNTKRDPQTGAEIIDPQTGRAMPGSGQSLSTALEKFNDNDRRTQNLIQEPLVAAAERFRVLQKNEAQARGLPVETKFEKEITNINQAKDMFGLLPGGRGGGPTGTMAGSTPPPSSSDGGPSSGSAPSGGGSPTPPNPPSGGGSPSDGGATPEPGFWTGPSAAPYRPRGGSSTGPGPDGTLRIPRDSPPVDITDAEPGPDNDSDGFDTGL